MFLEIPQNSQENPCAKVSFLIKLQASCNFIKKETLAQVFFCEFCGISKNTIFTEHLWATASIIHCLYQTENLHLRDAFWPVMTLGTSFLENVLRTERPLIYENQISWFQKYENYENSSVCSSVFNQWFWNFQLFFIKYLKDYGWQQFSSSSVCHFCIKNT